MSAPWGCTRGCTGRRGTSGRTAARSLRLLRPGAALVALAAAACGCALVCGCALGGPASTRADQQAIASCKVEADQAYLEQNRALLSERSQTDTPFSASGTVGVTSQGLGQLYGRSNDIEACLRGRRAADAATQPEASTGISPQMDPAGASQP